MPRVYCFEPIEDRTATVLILGSMPGKVSLATGRYYAHTRNAFWTIMGELIGAESGLPYTDRIDILRGSGIALWDVIASCIRTGSLDSDIQAGSVVPNDFNSFFLGHPDISRIYFNGAKAEQCFLKYVHPYLESAALQYRRLPSTSPANAGISYGQKLLAWQSVIARSAETP
ncbi:MAG TPA: DNA-deoxyinosine glycosylase [Gallionella sp.]|nr:DNA-deoxyinosine glycosylase [Gallionella sp.]